MPDSTENILTKHGYKNTRARKAMLEVMEKSFSPLTAEEIFLKVKEKSCSANLSTIYRNLSILLEKGLVTKTVMGDGRAIYQFKGEEHRHHLICTSCNKTIAIDICPLHNFEEDIKEKTNYEITDHRLELYGLCPRCKKINP